jgi:hypothetical protein
MSNQELGAAVLKRAKVAAEIPDVKLALWGIASVTAPSTTCETFVNQVTFTLVLVGEDVNGDALRHWLAQLEEFNRWEQKNPAPLRPFADVLADLGFLWNLIDPEIRLKDPDPEKFGIQEMRRAFERIAAGLGEKAAS